MNERLKEWRNDIECENDEKEKKWKRYKQSKRMREWKVNLAVTIGRRRSTLSENNNLKKKRIQNEKAERKTGEK